MKAIGITIGILALLFIALGTFIPARCSAREKARRIKCAYNLKQIGLALQQYAQDHDGYFPPENGLKGLKRLIENEYLTDLKLYLCPGKERANYDRHSFLGISFYRFEPPLTEEKLAYAYQGGLTVDCSPDSAVCWSQSCPHVYYGNILFLDGHVKGYRGQNWMDYVRHGANPQEQ